MSLPLRISVLVGSFLILFFIMKKIRKSQIKIADSVFWMLFAFALTLFALFPSLADALASLFGFVATSNFVLTFVVGIILIKEFNNAREISQLNHKVETLVQEMALADLAHRKEIEELKAAQTCNTSHKAEK